MQGVRNKASKIRMEKSSYQRLVKSMRRVVYRKINVLKSVTKVMPHNILVDWPILYKKNLITLN